jgi:hypothetical protein
MLATIVYDYESPEAAKFNFGNFKTSRSVFTDQNYDIISEIPMNQNMTKITKSAKSMVSHSYT